MCALENRGMACHQKTFFHLPLEKRPMARLENKKYLTKLLKEISDYFNGDVCIYGQDHIDIAEILWDEKIQNIPFILLEDGLGNYRTRKSLMKSGHGIFLRPSETFMGHNDRVQDIYLTGIWKIPNDLKKKVKILDIKDQWERKIDGEKQMFLDLYQLKHNILDILSQKTVCILSGAFSSFGIISAEEEICAYKKIISQFNPSDVYIKVHPTSYNIDFKKEFPEVLVFSSPAPFEVLYILIGNHMKTIVSIASTASMIVDEEVEQQFYDCEGNRIELKYPSNDLV